MGKAQPSVEQEAAEADPTRQSSGLAQWLWPLGNIKSRRCHKLRRAQRKVPGHRVEIYLASSFYIGLERSRSQAAYNVSKAQAPWALVSGDSHAVMLTPLLGTDRVTGDAVGAGEWLPNPLWLPAAVHS